MLRRSLASGLLAGVALLALLSPGCQNGRKGTDPATPAAVPQVPSSADGPISTISGDAIIGEYALTVSAAGVTLEPLAPRSLAAQGDSYDADITDFFRQFPCADCLYVDAFGLTPDFDVWVDIALRHPYKVSTLPGGRADLVVYDTRVILIPELDLLSTPLMKFAYPDSPKVKDGTPGGIDALGVWDIVRNADGYTHHYDVGVVDGVRYDGSLNPYRWYFNEDDFSAEFEGAEIPSRAFRPGDGPDIKRWLIDITDPDLPGLSIRRFRTIIEASWGQGTTKVDRINSVVRLPEYNIKEAYSVRTNLPQTIFGDTTTGTILSWDVEVLDWQAGAITGTGLDQVNCPSDVRTVTVDLPGLATSPGNERIFNVITQTTPSNGTGQPGDPYIYSFAAGTLPGPDLSALERAEPYLALIRVEDEYHDASLATQCQSGPPDADGKLRGNFIGGRLHNQDPLNKINADFVAYRIVPVFIRPAGPPTITLNPPIIDQVKGLATLSGTILGLDFTTQGLPSSAARTVTTITQVGPGGAPMNTPWVLPLQTDEYGRFQVTMPLLPNGPNTFTVTANNQYVGVIPSGTSNSSFPPITWNVDPTTIPSFRISLAWEPVSYAAGDLTDMDLHLWSPTAPASTVFDHLYYCNWIQGNGPGTASKPCTTSDSVVDVRYIHRDDNGFGPEVMDGINNISGTSLKINSAYPVGVNYFTNRRNSAAWPIRLSIRVAIYSGTPDLQLFTFTGPPSLNRENFNTPIEFYAGQGDQAEWERSWHRPFDLLVDGLGNVTLGPATILPADLAP